MDMPKYLSTQTIENTVVIKELMNLHQFDPGNFQAKESNGDMVWFTLTADEAFTSVLIFIITADAILIEYSLSDGVHQMAMITNIGEFVVWLRHHNFRRLTDDEWDMWTGNSGNSGDNDDEWPSWDEGG